MGADEGERGKREEEEVGIRWIGKMCMRGGYDVYKCVMVYGRKEGRIVEVDRKFC